MHPFLTDVGVTLLRIFLANLQGSLQKRTLSINTCERSFLGYKGAIQSLQSKWLYHIPVPCKFPWHKSTTYHLVLQDFIVSMLNRATEDILLYIFKPQVALVYEETI